MSARCPVCPESGNGWAIYEVRALDKDDAIERQICSTIKDGGLAGQAPLHGVRVAAAGVGAARHDATTPQGAGFDFVFVGC